MDRACPQESTIGACSTLGGPCAGGPRNHENYKDAPPSNL